MRGNPLWQLILVTVAFVGLGLPVWRLTRPAQAAAVQGRADGTAKEDVYAPAVNMVTLEVEADFAPVPTEWALSYLGEVVLKGKGEAKATASWKTALPAEGADLVLHAAWPTAAGTGMAAARVTVRWPDGREVEKSFWSPSGEVLDTVFTVVNGGSNGQ